MSFNAGLPDVLIHLRDRSADVVAAWRSAFDGAANVGISQGDIFSGAPQADAIVSPSNSFGYMEGGIDGAYSEYFGPGIAERLRAVLRAAWDGELPVGCAVIIETGHRDVPYLVSAPTMRVPGDVSATINAYLAFRAALIAVRELNRQRPGTIRSLLCPGLCTAHGGMTPHKSARQMRFAHRLIAEGEAALLDRPQKILLTHRELAAEM
jgi:O-acetyl-ADP-ribose deacetylase (regulator of RNase III)